MSAYAATVSPNPAPAGLRLHMVPMGVRHRLALAAVGALYLLLVMLLSAGNPSPNIEWVILSLALLLTTLIVPVLLYPEAHDWFHPFTFTALLTLFPLARRTRIFAFGL